MRRAMVDVLVVDPGELGELLTTLFEQYGFTARCARTGEQALEVALAERPGVVVVELDLPDASGLDVADLVRAELDAHVILTYTLSAADKAGQGFEARRASFDASFSRPFRSLTLIERAAGLLGRPLELTPAGDQPAPEPPPPRATEEEDVLLLDEVVEVKDALGYEHEEDIVLDIDVRDLAAPEVKEPAAPRRAAPPIEEISEEISVVPPPPTPRREGVAVTLSEFVAEPLHADPSDLAALWRRLQEEQARAPREERPSKAPPSRRAGPLTPKVLAELMDAFHQTQSSGEVWLTRNDRRRVILLERGVIVGARSNLAPEDLAQVALRRKALREEQIAAARAEVEAGRAKDFADAALALGLLDERGLSRLLREQVRRIVLSAFAWPDGRFEVTLEGRARRLRRKVRMTVGDAIVRGVVLVEELGSLREAAPDDARFAPNPGAAYGLEEVTLTDEEARLVIAMDGTKTVGDLATLFPEVPERVLRGLAAGLFRIGILRLAGRGPAEPRRISFF